MQRVAVGMEGGFVGRRDARPLPPFATKRRPKEAPTTAVSNQFLQPGSNHPGTPGGLESRRHAAAGARTDGPPSSADHGSAPGRGGPGANLQRASDDATPRRRRKSELEKQ